jgi:hypothetical protein
MRTALRLVTPFWPLSTCQPVDAWAVVDTRWLTARDRAGRMAHNKTMLSLERRSFVPSTALAFNLVSGRTAPLLE